MKKVFLFLTYQRQFNNNQKYPGTIHFYSQQTQKLAHFHSPSLNLNFPPHRPNQLQADDNRRHYSPLQSALQVSAHAFLTRSFFTI